MFSPASFSFLSFLCVKNDIHGLFRHARSIQTLSTFIFFTHFCIIATKIIIYYKEIPLPSYSRYNSTKVFDHTTNKKRNKVDKVKS